MFVFSNHLLSKNDARTLACASVSDGQVLYHISLCGDRGKIPKKIVEDAFESILPVFVLSPGLFGVEWCLTAGLAYRE